jgi:hypothetical protein
MAKYLLIAAVVISLVTAFLGYKNYQTLTETKSTLASTQGTLVTTTKNLETTKKNLATTTATLTTTTADKEKLSADLASTQSDLATAKSDLKKATDDAADKASQLASVQADFDKYKVDHPDTTVAGPGVEPSGPSPREQELQALVDSLQGKLKSEESELATLRDKEAKRQKGMMQEGLEGRVLAVNPAWNFVVLSIGDRQGVVNNAELLLKRGGQYLGKVRITSVEPSTSIADIVANTLPAGVSVQPGDNVIFQSAPTTEN